MPKALGIVISPKFVQTVVLDEEKKKYRIGGFFPIRIPYLLDTGMRLHYLRTFILDIIYSQEIEVLGLRIAERQSSRVSYERIEMEGVINELTAQAPIKTAYIGSLKEISQLLDKRKEIFDLLSGKLDYITIKDWYLCSNSESREAALTAMAAVKVAEREKITI